MSALLARGAAVDTCAEADGKTPLMLAAENGHVDTVRKFCSIASLSSLIVVAASLDLRIFLFVVSLT